jgi:hypothetical protein
MSITLKDAYGDDAILKLFPKPNYSHISTNIKVGDAIWIPFDDIYIDDDEGNIARSDGQDPSHLEDLKFSFSNGILVNEELGAVVRQPEGSHTPYKLLYGYGRTLSQDSLGAKGWAFNLIDANQTEQEDIASFENEPKAPKLINKEQDIIRLKSKQVKEKRISNNEDDIYANLKKTYPRRKKPSLDRIAAGIFEENDTPVKFAYYTDAKIKQWRKNHCAEWFEIGGKWDQTLQSYGYTTIIGGLYRTFHRARQNYHEGKFVSYVNAFTGQVSKGSTLEQQRTSIINEYIKLRVIDALVYDSDVKFLSLNGFFPQAYGKDHWSSFKEIDQDELEKKVKQAIREKRKLIAVQSSEEI